MAVNKSRVLFLIVFWCDDAITNSVLQQQKDCIKAPRLSSRSATREAKLNFALVSNVESYIQLSSSTLEMIPIKPSRQAVQWTLPTKCKILTQVPEGLKGSPHRQTKLLCFESLFCVRLNRYVYCWVYVLIFTRPVVIKSLHGMGIGIVSLQIFKAHLNKF